MYFNILLAALIAPLAVLATPLLPNNTTNGRARLHPRFPFTNATVISERQPIPTTNTTAIGMGSTVPIDNAPKIGKRLAVPLPFKNTTFISGRQAPVKPKPCQPISPTPTEAETNARFDRFADAFLVKKNVTAAFEYISQNYINHNPAAQNGFDSAWNILSPIWASQQITVLRTKFQGAQGWLNYRSGFGEVVDRYRWESGCIVEHWDQGESFPA
ncbi:hypothetical protein PVAG01_09010 [Phlyctema vagabunda]|uniref:SnoaL-like domain-containing protein n=1 Tax=Phlyctema vagabunda TaxID=108571 RepID=A0ABR4P648_9HELO